MNLQAFKAAIESKGHLCKLKDGYIIFRGIKINTEVLNNKRNNMNDIDFLED